MAEADLDLENRIDKIPGREGFWKLGTRETFIKTAENLLDHGYNKEEVIELLSHLWHAVADEYGD